MDALELMSYSAVYNPEFPVPFYTHIIYTAFMIFQPHFLKFILIIPVTGKNRECKCEHICLAALKFCMRKEFFQGDLG